MRAMTFLMELAACKGADTGIFSQWPIQAKVWKGASIEESVNKKRIQHSHFCNTLCSNGHQHISMRYV